jgi:hypothetical protein
MEEEGEGTGKNEDMFEGENEDSACEDSELKRRSAGRVAEESFSVCCNSFLQQGPPGVTESQRRRKTCRHP